MPDYRTECCAIECPDDIKQAWHELQKHADYSYFQSWGWIGVWLQQIAIDLQPLVVKVWFNEQLVGMGLFVSKDIKRRFIFRSRGMFLNEYPFDGRNMIIEYNGMLAAKGHEEGVYIETARFLFREFKGHDEFYFGAVVEGSTPFGSEKPCIKNANCLINKESMSRYVDLLSFSSGIDAYLASLSRNRRGQIRRSIRLYEQGGDLQISEANNAEQALAYFDRLKMLHSDYWQAKGESGSFANSQWENFHRTLIEQRFYAGEIQLLKVSNNADEIGYIYSLNLHTHIYVIQTGFRSAQDKRLMPGYVAHTLAIVYNQSKGMTAYDLMHDDVLYKRILCNRSRKLQWLVLQRKQLKFSVEALVVATVRAFREITGSEH